MRKGAIRIYTQYSSTLKGKLSRLSRDKDFPATGDEEESYSDSEYESYEVGHDRAGFGVRQAH